MSSKSRTTPAAARLLDEVDRLEEAWSDMNAPSVRLDALDRALAKGVEVTLAQYQLHRKIGAGGMGAVYEASDRSSGDKLALKILAPVSPSSTAEARFRWESRVATTLSHPNIVETRTVEECDGLHFLTMELVEGRKLNEIIPSAGMGVGQFFSLALALVRATEAAHARRLVHRDLKPDNIMVTGDGGLKVLDFGIAKSADPFLDSDLRAPMTLTGEDQIVGTIDYMSPEQAGAQAVDERSDVFSLGVVFYEMLTGTNPFARESRASTVATLLRDTPAPLNELRMDVPESVTQLVARCLAKKPSERFRNGSELRRALEFAYLGRGLTPLVGRRDELKSMDRAYRASAEGRLQCVVIAGNAGLGKSRLLHEFSEWKAIASGTTLHGYGDSSGTTAPFKPFVQMLQELFDVSAGDDPVQVESRVAQKLGELSSSELRPDAFTSLLTASATASGVIQQGAILALGRLVRALAAAASPVTLIFDDWQWADDASHQALNHIVRSSANEPVLILLGVGNPDRVGLPTDRVQVLELGPLSVEQSRDAIRALIPTALDLGVTAKLHALSGGNPLFMEELCRALPNSCTSDDVDELFTAPSGPSTHELIQHRVRRLPDGELRLLQEAAVIGVEFPVWLLKKLSRRRHCARDLAKLSEKDFIYPLRGDVYRFKHGIARVVVYNSIQSESRVRSLHRRAAVALESRFENQLTDYCEQLAHHFSHSGDAEEKAAEYGRQAGDKALATGSLDRARHQYGVTLDVLDDVNRSRDARAEWLRVCGKWAQACIYSPALEQVDVLSKAVRYATELGDETALAQGHYWLGWIQYALGCQSLSIHHCNEALATAERLGLDRLTAQLLLNLGQSYAAAGAYPEAIELLDRGLALQSERSMKAKPTVPVGYAYALGCKALVHGDMGEFDTARASLASALDLVADGEHPLRGSLLCLVGMVQLWQGLWAECSETAVAIRRNAERVAGPYVFAMGRILGACARWKLHASTDAIRELQATTDWLEARGIRLYLSFNYGFLADALAASGQTQLAVAYAEKAVSRAAEQDPIGESMAHRILAQVGGDRSRARARSHLDRAIRTSHARGSKRDAALGHLSLAGLLAREGQKTSAIHSATRARDELDRMSMRWHLERAERLLRTLSKSQQGA